MDNTNLIILQSIQQSTRSAFQSMISAMLPLLNLSPELASDSVRVLEPVYGSKNTVFRNAAVMGFVSTVAYTMAMALSVTVFILDKLSGLLPRIGAAGVRSVVGCGLMTSHPSRPTELIFGHIGSQIATSIIGIIVTLVFAIDVFNIPDVGSIGVFAAVHHRASHCQCWRAC